jgi:hypothetical protein
MISDEGRSTLQHAVSDERARHRAAAAMGDTSAAWRALERAHILSQPLLGLHMGVHGSMLRYALRTLDPVEAIGQLIRLLLAPIGALAGRIPAGNTGRARVNAFAQMPVSDDLRAIIERSSR